MDSPGDLDSTVSSEMDGSVCPEYGQAFTHWLTGGQGGNGDASSKFFFCVKCPNLEITNMAALVLHHRVAHAYAEDCIACGICHAVCPTGKAVGQHLSRVHGKDYRVKRCPLCDFITRSAEKLEEHRLVDHQGESFYDCDFCGHENKSKAELRQHERDNHSEQVYNQYCDKCNKTFKKKNLSVLRYHYRTMHRGINNFSCSLCGAKFGKPSKLYQHQKAVHPTEVPIRDMGVKVTKKYKCEVEGCGFITTFSTSLKDHNRLYHSQVQVKCALCTEEHTSRFELYVHMEEKHSEDSSAAIRDIFVNKYPCMECNSTFPSTSAREAHNKRTHTAEGMQKSYKCQFCEATFENVLNRDRHVRGTHDTNALCPPCPICHESFALPEDLRHHFETNHTTVEPKRKEEDDDEEGENDTKTFVPNTELYVPKDGKLAFECQVCGMSFNFYMSLNLHCMMEHCSEVNPTLIGSKEPKAKRRRMDNDETNVKPEPDDVEHKVFSCEHCESHFDSAEHYQWHVDTAHQAQQFMRIRVKVVVQKKTELQMGPVAARAVHSRLKTIRTKQKGIVMQNKANSKILCCSNVVNCGFVPTNMFAKLNYHMKACKIHHKEDASDKIEKKAMCLRCDEAFKSTPELRDHVLASHPREFQIFRCDYCKFGCSTSSTIKCHIECAHPYVAHYTCEVCPIKFFSTEERDNHMAREHPSAAVGRQCPFCNRICSSRKGCSNLSSHLKLVHGIGGKPKEEVEYRKKIYKPTGIMMTNATNPDVYACSKCPSFPPGVLIGVLENHFRNVHAYDETSSQCNICKKVFADCISLKNHVRDEHKHEFQVKRCEHCKFGTDVLGKLRAHLLAEHPGVPAIKCKYCSAMFVGTDEMEAHMSRDHEDEEKKRTCPHCDKKFHLPTGVRKHILLFHPSEADLPPPVQQAEEDWQKIKGWNQCHYEGCLFGSKNKTTVTKHIRIVHMKEKNYKCDQCDKMFALRSHLNRHHDSIHNESKKPFVCVCGSEFLRRENLRIHKFRENCENLRWDECRICNTKFPNMADYLKHMSETHSFQSAAQIGHKQHPVIQKKENGSPVAPQQSTAVASESISTPDSMLPVLNLKTSKHVECTYEGCAFFCPNQSRMDKHVNEVHLLIKPFPCEHCDKAFSNRVHRRDHINAVHLGIRPFMCETCGQSFSRRYNLNKHKMGSNCKNPVDSNDGEEKEKERNANATKQEKMYSCDMCGKSYLYKQSLTQHIASIHLALKPFQCDECGQTFTQKHHLRCHRVRVHEAGDDVMPFQCHICMSRFVVETSWKYHMRKYHDENVVVTTANHQTDTTT